jgi:hypothetical protein
MFFAYFESEYTALLSRKSPESTGPLLRPYRNSLPELCGTAKNIRGGPCLEDFRAIHQRMMQMWKDRVSGEANATHQLTLRHAITRFHDHAAGLHVYKPAVLAILMIEQHEIADVFRIFVGREFWIPSAIEATGLSRFLRSCYDNFVMTICSISYWRFMGGSDRNTSNSGHSAQTVHDTQSVHRRINTGDCAYR